MANLQSTVCSSKGGAIHRPKYFDCALKGVLPMQKITISVFAATLGAALLVSLIAP
jgi:hypothetical protein